MKTDTSKENAKGCILVLKDAWVMYGIPERLEDGRTRLTNALNIRIWGTENGLGELAAAGPRAHTKLDPIGVVIIEPHDLKFTIPCEGDLWTAS